MQSVSESVARFWLVIPGASSSLRFNAATAVETIDAHNARRDRQTPPMLLFRLSFHRDELIFIVLPLLCVA